MALDRPLTRPSPKGAPSTREQMAGRNWNSEGEGVARDRPGPAPCLHALSLATGPEKRVFRVSPTGHPLETDCAWKAMEAHPTLRNCAAVDPRAPRGSMPMTVVMLTGEKKMLPSFVLLSSLKRSIPNTVIAAPSESMKILARSRTTIEPEGAHFTYLNGFGSQDSFLLLFLFLH